MNDEASAPDPVPHLEPDPEHQCDYCGLTWGFGEPPPLSNMCEHGGAGHNRVFADCARVSTLPDGRVLIQLDLPPGVLDGQHVCCLITGNDGERLRVKFARVGAAAVAERWRA